MRQPPFRPERIDLMPDLYRALDNLARSRDITVEELVEDTLIELVEKHRPLKVVGKENAPRPGEHEAKVIALNGGQK